MNRSTYLKQVCVMSALLSLVLGSSLFQVSAQGRTDLSQIAWNPDGTEIAFAGGTYPCDAENPQLFPIRILTISTGQTENRFIGHQCPQVDVNWSPDGTMLASSGFNGEAFIWDAVTYQLLVSAPFRTGAGIEMVWKPDSSQIASVTGGYYAFVWDPSTAAILYSLPDHDQPTTSVIWKPDGTQLATSSLDNTVRVWDAETQGQVLLLQHSAPVYWVVWSPDGSKIATVGGNGFVGIWNSQNGSLIRSMSGYSDSVYVVDWSPDGTRIATGGADRAVRTWDVDSGQLLDTVTSEDPIVDLDWNPVNDQVAFIDTYTGSHDDLPEIFVSSDPIPPTATPSPSPTPIVCDYSIQSGDVSYLAQSIEEANATPESFENICLATEGSYNVESPDMSGYALPAITGEIAIFGNGSTLTRDSETTEEFGILRVENSGTLYLSNLTIRNGYNSAGSEPSGGAISNAGIVVVTGSTLENNTAVDYGGAIFNTGTLTLIDSAIAGNTALTY